MHLPILVAAVVVASQLTSTPEPSGNLPMNADEFRLWRDYQDALGDARVQKMPEKQRLPAIAKNFKVSEKTLAAAVEKGNAHGDQMGTLTEQSIRSALAATSFAPRLKEVRVDASAAHVIAYVTFKAENADAVDREACLAAARTGKSAPLAATIKIEVVDPADDGRALFDGLISSQAAGRISEERIVDFASTRYVKLFEKVKRAE